MVQMLGVVNALKEALGRGPWKQRWVVMMMAWKTLTEIYSHRAARQRRSFRRQ